MFIYANECAVNTKVGWVEQSLLRRYCTFSKCVSLCHRPTLDANDFAVFPFIGNGNLKTRRTFSFLFSLSLSDDNLPRTNYENGESINLEYYIIHGAAAAAASAATDRNVWQKRLLVGVAKRICQTCQRMTDNLIFYPLLRWGIKC